eukprot:TRINITY_DN2082_c0_g1_i1.p1 TRINITY_DN2082_c0_g1~~TRINITY_DN2082_c0_g1_i1.p1  ORF type:complete len:397 (+),score=162.99 TRINITY_DN2082_c0_g1_i1:64-1254(+)
MSAYAALLAAAFTTGAAAQTGAEVHYVGGGQAAMQTGPAFAGQSWSGGAGTIANVPSYLGQADVRYFDVDPGLGAELELRPETTAGAPGRGAAELGLKGGRCGQGWARNPDPARASCFDEFAGKKAGWGFTNSISPGETVRAPVYISKFENTRFEIEVSYVVGEGGSEIVVGLAPNAGMEVKSASIYVGADKLPRGRSGKVKGKFETSPDVFPIKVGRKRDADVVEVSKHTPLDIDGVRSFYFAVNVKLCRERGGTDPEPEAEREPESMGMEVDPVTAAPECETTFFASVFTCLDSECVQRSTGDVHAELTAAGWAMYTDAPRFTTSTSGLVYNTRVYARTVAESEGPVTIPASPFMGVFAAGCGVTAVPRQALATVLNIGPWRDLCTQYCPAGAV